MVKFDTGEFEIAIVTYKRPEFVKVWLDNCYEPAIERNIVVSIYDSSPDVETKEMIDSFNATKSIPVLYYHVDEETIIGYKPMIPILKTKSEYLWVSGDSRYHDFSKLDEKLFPLLKEKSIDYAVINIGNNHQMPDTVFDDKGKMIHACFIATTCIGLSIYRTDIFNPIRNNPVMLKEYDDKFRHNFAFAWLGYFYSVYAMSNYKAAIINVAIKDIMSKHKTQTWRVRFYGCWAEDLCQIIDNIPDSYKNKELIPKETWEVMRLNSISYGYKARKYGDLNVQKYHELEENGTIARLTNNPSKIKFFATAPMIFVECINFAYEILLPWKRVCNKVVKIISGRKNR